jgi:hypothetical protein
MRGVSEDEQGRLAAVGMDPHDRLHDTRETRLQSPAVGTQRPREPVSSPASERWGRPRSAYRYPHDVGPWSSPVDGIHAMNLVGAIGSRKPAHKIPPKNERLKRDRVLP